MPRWRRALPPVLLVVSLLSLLFSPTFAQTTDNMFSGVIVDQNYAAIPSVIVTRFLCSTKILSVLIAESYRNPVSENFGCVFATTTSYWLRRVGLIDDLKIRNRSLGNINKQHGTGTRYIGRRQL